MFGKQGVEAGTISNKFVISQGTPLAVIIISDKMAVTQKSFKDGLFKITNKPITKETISKMKIELEDAYVTHFVAYRNDLDHENTVELCKLVKKHHIQCLYLWVNNVDDITVKRITSCFSASKHLVNLDLSRNAITDKGVSIIASAFTYDSVLATLDLSYNKVGDVGAEYLANAMDTNLHLTSLNLSFNQIHNRGAEALIQKIRSINYLCKVGLDGMDPISPGKILLLSYLGNANSLAREKQAASLIKFGRLLMLVNPGLPQEVILRIIDSQMGCFTSTEKSILTRTIFSTLFLGWFNSPANFKLDQLLGICRGFLSNKDHFENLRNLQWERTKAQRDYQMLVFRYQSLLAERRKMTFLVYAARVYGPMFSWVFNLIRTIVA